jgi:hypothetical protein
MQSEPIDLNPAIEEKAAQTNFIYQPKIQSLTCKSLHKDEKELGFHFIPSQRNS